jgi:hypothetical protein
MPQTKRGLADCRLLINRDDATRLRFYPICVNLRKSADNSTLIARQEIDKPIDRIHIAATRNASASLTSSAATQ